MANWLICFDMDGVIFEDINFWIELHRAFGTLHLGIRLTEKYLHTDYARLVSEVVARLWKGKDAVPYYKLVGSVKYLPGVKKTFDYIRLRGHMTAIISASSIDLAKRAKRDLGIDRVFANELVIRNGRVTGEFIWPVGAGKESKARIIKSLCSDLGVPPERVFYVGDSESDIEAFKTAGVSVAFNSSAQRLKQLATYVVDSSNLSDIIEYIP